MAAPPPNPAIAANYPRHCDEYIDDPKAPACLRAYLRRARSPAHGHTSSEPYPKLFATYRGKEWKGIAPGDRVRVVMASRMGDVGVTKDLAAEHGYPARCAVEQLSDFSDSPPAAPAPRGRSALPSDLPAELPRVPLGFTQRHIGDRDGISVYAVVAPGGGQLPITWRHKPAERHDHEFRGYTLEGDTAIHKTWGELAAAWPAWFAAHAPQRAPEVRRG